MANGNGNVHPAERLGSWAALIGLGLYVLYVGQWVGAADEKLASAKETADTQEDIKERLTRLEEQVESNDEKSAVRDQQILKAIEKLEKKLEEDDG